MNLIKRKRPDVTATAAEVANALGLPARPEALNDTLRYMAQLATAPIGVLTVTVDPRTNGINAWGVHSNGAMMDRAVMLDALRAVVREWEKATEPPPAPHPTPPTSAPSNG